MVQARIAALPEVITPEDAVQWTYGVPHGDQRESDLDWIISRLTGGLSVLVECDAQIATAIYLAVRGNMQGRGMIFRPTRERPDAETPDGQFRFEVAAGTPRRGRRPRAESEEGEEPEERGAMGDLIARTMAQIEDFVQARAERTILVVPHFDILATTTKSGLGREARILIQLLDDPGIHVLAFKDPEYEIPEALLRAFPAHRSLMGIPRDALVPAGSLAVERPRRAPAAGRGFAAGVGRGQARAPGGGGSLITRAEARKFGIETFDPFALYKYLSGTNASRARQILEQIARRHPDFDPANPSTLDAVFHELRELTISSDLEIPNVDLDRDIGGYDDVKRRIREILDLVRMRDEADTVQQMKEIEDDIPRGIIFEGPPGTGKTYFAKAFASALDATTIVVSGPEIKSKWVGESEQNLRNIFTRARQSAPAVIIFDEIDSIAGARGEGGGDTAGAMHGIVNTLLTEMDGFRKEELVFVVGTTNFSKSLDPALLRPGRFAERIEVAAPNDKDRRAILSLLFRKSGLDCPEDVMDFAVKETAGYADSANRRNFAGDDLRAIVAKVRRGRRLSSEVRDATVSREEVESAIRETIVGGRSGGGFETPDVDFDRDIAGYDAVKSRLRREFLDLVEIRERMIREGAPVEDIADLEARIPRGILLWGPPGTGKTYFAKALATSLGGSLIVISAAELKSKWYGQTEENIRDVFAQARASAPSVVVFDELDSIARTRGGGEGGFGSATDDSIINTLLTEMDGFRGDELVFVVGTTNRPDTLDPALLRPSRLALKVEVPAPGAADRAAILRHYAGRAGLDISEDDLARLVQKTAGLAGPGRRFAGDDLRAIIDSIQNKKVRAKFGYSSNPRRRRRNGEKVSMSEIDAALEEVAGPGAAGEGPRQLTKEEKVAELRGTAYHECGHAIAAALTPGASFPYKVSIDAPEDANFLGVTMKEAKEGNLTKREILAEIGAALAGRVADEIVGQAETGAHSDLEQATSLAGVMVAELGMSERLGPVVYGRRQISQEFMSLVDEEIRDIVKGEYARVQTLLESHQQLLDDMANLLLEKKTLDHVDIANFFTERGFGDYVPKSMAAQVVKKNAGKGTRRNGKKGRKRR